MRSLALFLLLTLTACTTDPGRQGREFNAASRGMFKERAR